jgi:hypothetical protein
MDVLGPDRSSSFHKKCPDGAVMWRKKRILTELVSTDHEYTSVDVPWQIDDDEGKKLFRYLRSGGVSAFGCTSQEMARSRRQTRFLVVFGVMSAVWFVLWLF